MGQELNSIKTGTKSATLSIPENDGSPVVTDKLMLSAEFSAPNVIPFSREEAQTRSGPTNRLGMWFGNHTTSTSARPWKLPLDMEQKTLQSCSKSEATSRGDEKTSFKSARIK